MRFLVLLLLAGCVDTAITPEDWADAERMCAGQKGVAWAENSTKWLAVKCENGMTFAKRRQEDE